MTVALLSTPEVRRKAVLDTCAVFEDEVWRERMKDRVQGWLGDDGIAVLPARVIAEIARVAANKFFGNAQEKEVALGRAALVLDSPEEMLGFEAVRRAVLSRADVDQLCRDNADLDLVREESKEHWKTRAVSRVTVPGDADFEIAHTVRVLTGAGHEAVLVTRDGDLRAASDRLGVALLGRPVPTPRVAVPAAGAGAPLPSPDGGGTVYLLSLEATVQLLAGPLPGFGAEGDTAVVLSSTLVRAAQRVARQTQRDAEKHPDRPAQTEAVQKRLDRLMCTGRLGKRKAAVHVMATPWDVYELAARRVTDVRFGLDTDGRGALDMHTLLVLSAAQFLGDDGHRVQLVDARSWKGEGFVTAGARNWRSAGALGDLVGAVEHDPRAKRLDEVALPAAGGGLDLSALLRKYDRPD